MAGSEGSGFIVGPEGTWNCGGCRGGFRREGTGQHGERMRLEGKGDVLCEGDSKGEAVCGNVRNDVWGWKGGGSSGTRMLRGVKWGVEFLAGK